MLSSIAVRPYLFSQNVLGSFNHKNIVNGFLPTNVTYCKSTAMFLKSRMEDCQI